MQIVLYRNSQSAIKAVACGGHLIELQYHVTLYVPLVDYKVTEKSFNFARKNHLPFYFVSASDGTNVVKVSINWSKYSNDAHVFRYLKKP